MDYGTCEGCGGNVAEHCIEDATDCIAKWPAAGSTPEQRERIHASLCGAKDYGAALSLYWWMHLASEHFYGESWPFQWEDQLRAWAEAGLPAGTREPYAGWREEGRRLYAAAGGQWRDASDGRLFVRTEGTLTPAEIEAEAERLFAAWAAPQPHRLDFDMLGELARGPWLAVAEASLAARASLTDAQVEGFAQTAVDDICKGFERPRSVIARAIRAALNADAQPLQRKDNPATPATDDDDLNLGDVEAGDRDRDALAKAHRRIAALPEEKRHEAARRLSRSYSAPRTCVEHDGCQREGDEIVWPDGERWPTRTERT